MPGNPHVRFDEGRVGRHLGAHPLSYSTDSPETKSAPLKTKGLPRLTLFPISIDPGTGLDAPRRKMLSHS